MVVFTFYYLYLTVSSLCLFVMAFYQVKISPLIAMFFLYYFFDLPYVYIKRINGGQIYFTWWCGLNYFWVQDDVVFFVPT